MPKNHPPLTAERLREFLSYDPETGLFRWRKAGSRVACNSIAGTKCRNGYQQIRILKRSYRTHRLAWLYVHGRWPEDQLDHINGVRDDNRIANLREATRAENLQNMAMRKDNKSGERGVSWNAKQGRWQAYIQANKVKHYLGAFDDKSDAVAARAAAKSALHEFQPYERSGEMK